MSGGLAVVVTAAGRSRRFGEGNKLLVPLLGRPVLAWTLAAFEACDAVEALYVTAPPDDEATYRDILRDVAPRTGRDVFLGGEERQHSIFLALQRLAQAPPAWVAVHDGARPLLTPALVADLLDVCQTRGHGVVPGTPPTDTIKRVEGAGTVVETLSRSTLMAVQTPQVFPWDVLWSAHCRAAEERVVATDDAALVERYGGPIVVAPGDPRNIKVTLPHDVWVAEQWLLRRNGNQFATS